MENIFFTNWESIIRTFTVTILAYFAMIVLLRASGKRALSKMNAFDFIVTIALGSVLASLSLNKNVSLADGVTAFVALLFLQYLLTWLSVRFSPVKQIITSQPVLLLYKGKVLKDVMKKERITMDELYMAARKKGISDLSQIGTVVLETTGDITIMTDTADKQAETLTTVKSPSL